MIFGFMCTSKIVFFLFIKYSRTNIFHGRSRYTFYWYFKQKQRKMNSYTSFYGRSIGREYKVASIHIN